MTVGPPDASAPYPFARLDAAKQQITERGIDLIDFGVGDPQDPTPQFIREALASAIPEVSSYPRAAGLPEHRETIARWLHQRFGVTIDNNDVLPTIGSKEIIHSLPAYVLTESRNTVVVPTPAYPVYARGAHFHGADVVELPLVAQNDYLPDLDSVSADVWQRTALLWLNYPNNPTAATAPIELYEQAAELAREHGFLLASDEAYSEIWFDEPPVSALQLDDLSNVVVVNTLSKRSCMTGYRSGFVAGSSRVIKRIRDYRASVGVTPQDFVQYAAIAAWNDEPHVEQMRALWKSKRDLLMPVFETAGHDVTADATFFLWIAVPDGATSDAFAERLLSVGVVVSPGTIFGDSGAGYVRVALVPSLERCREAAARLTTLFGV